MGAYGIGSISGAYIGGELSDRFDAYRVQLTSLLLSALTLLIFISLSTFYPILFCMFFYALFTDMLRPANSVATAQYSTEQNRTRSYSLMRFAANLGFAIGPAIGGIIAGTAGYLYIFVIDIISCLIAAFILSRFLKPKKNLQLRHQEDPLPLNRSQSLSAYKDRTYLFFIFLVSLYAISFFQLFASLPVFLKQDWTWSEERVGLLLALNGLFIVVFEMPYMRRIEGKYNPWLMMSWGGAALILGYLFIILNYQSLLIALLVIVLFSLSEMFAMPFMTQYAISRPSVDRRGQYMALYSMAYGVAHAVAPLGALMVADKYGFIPMYTITLIISILITCGFYYNYRR
jgi:predicted MFS family arabinose efflux permease